jgi:hypothetical protein
MPCLTLHGTSARYYAQWRARSQDCLQGVQLLPGCTPADDLAKSCLVTSDEMFAKLSVRGACILQACYKHGRLPSR